MLHTQFFSIFNTILNDAAQPWQLGFQDSAAPGFTGIVTLHNSIGFYLILISFGAFWSLFSIIYYYNNKKNPIPYKYLTHGSLKSLPIFFSKDIKYNNINNNLFLSQSRSFHTLTTYNQLRFDFIKIGLVIRHSCEARSAKREARS
jgi:hypothetical protein